MKVICTLPNAPSLVHNVRFVSHARGMISEDIPEDVAARLLRVTGYESSDKPAAAAPGPTTDPAALAILEAAAKTAPLRTGPLEPDPDMVICPTCTSQFRAIPTNVQAQLQALASKPRKGSGGPVPTAAAPTTAPPGQTSTASTEEKPAPSTSDPQF